jgi:hypothetical protein
MFQLCQGAVSEEEEEEEEENQVLFVVKEFNLYFLFLPVFYFIFVVLTVDIYCVGWEWLQKA